MRAFRAALPALALAVACLSAAAGEKHQHGVARLDVAVDGTRITIVLDTPLDNLVGFEHAPRTPAEQRAADTALATLRDAARLFRFDAAAQCGPGAPTLTSAALGLGTATPAARGEHADLEASWEFACARVPVRIEHGLFEAFARLQRLEVQSVGPTRQAGATLQRPAARLPL